MQAKGETIWFPKPKVSQASAGRKVSKVELIAMDSKESELGNTLWYSCLSRSPSLRSAKLRGLRLAALEVMVGLKLADSSLCTRLLLQVSFIAWAISPQLCNIPTDAHSHPDASIAVTSLA